MKDYRDNRIFCNKLESTEMILDAFRNGTPSITKGELIFTPEIFNWNLRYLSDQFGEKLIYTYNSVINKDIQQVKISSLVDDLMNFNHTVETMELDAKYSLHGVINCRRFVDENLVFKEFRELFRHQVSFLWVGLSSGRLHYDWFNNILVQVSGTKRVILFPANVCDKIGKRMHCYLEDRSYIFADVNLKKHEWLSEIPYYDIELSPGDALVIPAVSYHSVLGLSADSVSVNAFVTPKINNKIFNENALNRRKYPWWVTNSRLSLSKAMFFMTGKPLWRSGPYEFF